MKTDLLRNSLIGTMFIISAIWTNVFSQNTNSQTTEGTDFWVTFLQGDADDSDNKYKLSLSISAREATTVTIENSHWGFRQTVSVGDNDLQEVILFDGIANEEKIRNNNSDYSATSEANGNAKYCYSYHPEIPYYSALHVKSDKPISLFASNYKKATFDATNVLPTAALLNEYIVQCYTPSDHGGTHQGSHFAIVATEDNTMVEYSPTVETKGEFGEFLKALNAWGPDQVFEVYPEYERFRDYLTTGMISTPPLMAGQVYYVWTGTGSNDKGHDFDLSGTHIKANKKIAVFQGNPHTNLPYYKDYGAEIGSSSGKLGERDHVYLQAMPTETWGNTFAIVSSNGRKRDVIRLMAIHDGTEVIINGDTVHTFDFSDNSTTNSNGTIHIKNKKQYIEFEIGDENVSGGKSSGDYKDRPKPLVIGSNCFIKTSCPCAVHLFETGHYWDGHDGNDGDPAMMWINPIEQQIDLITFNSYNSDNGTTNHYVNVVTETTNVPNMKLDGNPLTGFQDVVGSNGKYQFVQHSLGTSATNHTLLLENATNGQGFIASVYGFTKNESYAYNAGGSAKILTQAITINGEIFTPESNNILCGEDNINFSCDLNYEWESITWDFGDGSPQVTDQDNVSHFYNENGVYHAYVLIGRYSSNVCQGQSAIDSIPITVNIGRFEFEIGVPEGEMCRKDGEPRQFRIPFNNKSNTPFEGDNVEIGFNQEALDDGFTNNDLQVLPDMFIVNIPETAEAGNNYGIHIHIESTNNCGETDTTLYFRVNYEADDIITQRFDNVLGLLSVAFQDDELSDFHWYKNEELMENEQNAVLYLETPDTISEYYVCFTINKGTAQEVTTCSCPKKFSSNKDGYQFETDAQMITLQYITNQDIFVNTKEEATATWFRIDGNKLTESTITAGGGLITTPNDKGLYVLRIVAGKQQRSFKILVSDVQPL